MANKTAKQIGGRIAADYSTLKQAVAEINHYYAPILEATGLFESTDVSRILNAIQYGESGIKTLFVRKALEDIEAGKIRKETIIKARHIVTADTPPEEREKRLKKERTEIQRALKYRFREITDYLRREYNWSCQRVFYRYWEIATFCQNCLYVGKNGIEVSESKFVPFYEAFVEAEESITGQLHKEAAEALTRFFGGALEITEAELTRYFVFDGRAVKPNPASINAHDYSRLGIRIVKTIKRE